MADKHYGLSKGYGEKVKDDAPEWMDKVLEALEQPKEKKPHPFYGIDDPILNPQKIGVDNKE